MILVLCLQLWPLTMISKTNILRFQMWFLAVMIWIFSSNYLITNKSKWKHAWNAHNARVIIDSHMSLYGWLLHVILWFIVGDFWILDLLLLNLMVLFMINVRCMGKFVRDKIHKIDCTYSLLSALPCSKSWNYMNAFILQWFLPSLSHYRCSIMI